MPLLEFINPETSSSTLLQCSRLSPECATFSPLRWVKLKLTVHAQKTQIGKVDEILGPINGVHFTVKPQEGFVATSFKSGDKFYIGGDKLLPLEKYDFQMIRKTPLLNQKQVSS